MPQQRVRKVTVIVESSPQQRIELGKLPKTRAEKAKAQLEAKSGSSLVRVELGDVENQEMEDPAR